MARKTTEEAEGFTSYVQYKNGEFVDVEKCDLVRVLNEKEDSLDDEM